MDDVTVIRIREIKHQTIAPCTILGYLDAIAMNLDTTHVRLRRTRTRQGRGLLNKQSMP